MKKMLSLSLVTFMVFGLLSVCVNAVKGEEIETEVRELSAEEIYSITPVEKEEWARLTTLSEKVEACRLDEHVLNVMTDEEVLNAVLKFPLICHLFVYEDEEKGLRKLEEQSSAYAELLTRPKAYAVIKSKLDSLTGEEADPLEEMVLTILLNDFEESNMDSLRKTFIESIPFSISKTVTTPKGTQVEVTERSKSEDFTMEQKNRGWRV